MMRYHCERWGRNNFISLAVLTDDDADAILDEITSKHIGCRRRRVTVSTISEATISHDEDPTHALQNLALSKVKTSHVVCVDIGFWTGEDLHEILNYDFVRNEFAAYSKLVAVLPAFELSSYCGETKKCDVLDHVSIMPRSKDDVLKLEYLGKLDPLYQRIKKNQSSISYSSWFEQDLGEFLDVSCIGSNCHEPFLAFRYCDELPQFQNNIHGYGRNTITVSCNSFTESAWPICFNANFVILLLNNICQVGNVPRTKWIPFFSTWRCLRHTLSSKYEEYKVGVD